MKASLTTFCALLISYVSFCQTGEKQEWKSLDESGYSIQYPAEWTLDKSGQMGTSFILFTSLTSPADQFRENINLGIQDLTGLNLDLDKYTQISTDQIKTIMTNGNLLVSEKKNRNGSDFQHVIFTGDQGQFKLKFEQFYWVRDNKAYILTLTCEASQFDSYQETGRKIMDSFKLK